MKKGKRLVSNVDNGDFEFEPIDMDETFEPFPGFDVPPVNYTGNQEQDAKDELRYVHDALFWVDQHPPKTKDILDSNIFLTVVFESRSQMEKFLEDIDIFQYGDKYISALIFEKAFNLDLKHGKPVSIAPTKKENQGFELSLDFDFDFGGLSEEPKKPEIGERLKNIKADEKRTKEYLAWAVDPSFWFCICFKTEEQKVNFQSSLGIQTERYAGFDVIWCHDFAKPFNVPLEKCDFKPRVWNGKLDNKLMPLIWNGETE